MAKVHFISAQELLIERAEELLRDDFKIALSDDAKQRIIRCRDYLEDFLEKSDSPIYGINTGFGSLCDRSVSKSEIEILQQNLVMSHACGMGDEVPQEIVRLMLLLKIQSLSYGYSAIRLSTVERLVEFFNSGITPVVYMYGSLGASGDLAPLAHMSLPLTGMGEVYYRGERYNSRELHNKMGWEPVKLKAKEGLALLNGTQFMLAYGIHCYLRSLRCLRIADVTGALSLDAFDGRVEPFDDLAGKIRPHNGQIITARIIRALLEETEISGRNKKHVQDPYSFRCIPQVHGAARDAVEYIGNIFKKELNSVTDNPLVFPEEGKILSAGNFHGQPLALALDFLCIALAETGSISERRTYQLLSGKRGLPSFLVANPGLNSGFMIPQYTAASMVSRNKQLCTPASVDTIDSSQGQEDHVSMGANAALKAAEVISNVERILSIELFTAAQALEFRRPLKTSPMLEKLIKDYRRKVEFISNDRPMYTEMKASLDFLLNLKDIPPGQEEGES